MIPLCTISGNRDGWVHTTTNGNTAEFLKQTPFLLCGHFKHSIFFYPLYTGHLSAMPSQPRKHISNYQNYISTMAN